MTFSSATEHTFFQILPDTDRSSFGESRFYVYIRDLSIYILQRFCLAIVILIGGVGILTRFFYEGSQFRALFLWRVIIVLFTSLLVLTFTYSKQARRWFIPLYVLEYSVVMFVSGYLLVQVQDHRNIGIAVLISLPLWTIPLPAKLDIRIYTISCSFLAIPGMYLIVGWEPIFLTIISLYLAIMAAVSIFLGHGIFYRLNRENFFNRHELKKKRQEIEYMARHDQLTGLLNRRSFEECLNEETNRVERYENPLSLIMLDLDHFKEINDTYGHSVGDKILETFGELLRSESRNTDSVGRIGGEEFAILLPETPIEEAIESAKRIRQKLENLDFSAGNESFKVTCSIGVTEWNPDDTSSDDMLKRADEALYRAKNQGRNQVVSAQKTV